MAGHAHATIRPLLLRHALPHIPAHGFTSAALSRASLSLPPPYQYSAALPQIGIETLFGRGREPERALVYEWLAERRETLKAEFKALKLDREASKQKVELREVLERRLEMNEEVRPYLADAFALFSVMATPLPVIGVGVKNPFPILNHSLHIADDALQLAQPRRADLHETIPLSLVYLATELHQLSLPLDEPSMPSTRAFLARRLEGYAELQGTLGEAGQITTALGNALVGLVRSRTF